MPVRKPDAQVRRHQSLAPRALAGDQLSGPGEVVALSTPVTLECPSCSAEVPTTVEDFKAGVPLECQGCGRRTDTNANVASYELMLKWPGVFLGSVE